MARNGRQIGSEILDRHLPERCIEMGRNTLFGNRDPKTGYILLTGSGEHMSIELLGS